MPDFLGIIFSIFQTIHEFITTETNEFVSEFLTLISPIVNPIYAAIKNIFVF